MLELSLTRACVCAVCIVCEYVLRVLPGWPWSAVALRPWRVCSVAFQCVGSSTGQQERCCGLDRCQLGEGAACCRSVGVAASSGLAWSSWATWSESRGSWRECRVWRIAPGASAYLYPPCSFLLGRRFHFSVKKAKIQEHLSSPKKNTVHLPHPSVGE